MGQSKIAEGRWTEVTLSIWTRPADKPDSRFDFMGDITLEVPSHLRGREARFTVESRAGAIAGLLLYPDEPSVVDAVKQAFTAAAAEQILPSLAQLAEKLTGSDWFMTVASKWTPEEPALTFFSSAAVADEVSTEGSTQAVDAEAFAKLAGTIA